MEFYKNKKVFITGHTGFKGSWMCKTLLELGAEVIGYSLESTTEPALFNLLNLKKNTHTIIGDIRDLNKLKEALNESKPDIVIHMAAQPLVIDSYKNPVYTYDTNVMGTVNILEAVRNNNCVKSFLNITTDKVYKNNEWAWGYRENDTLDGYDPYSNSKSCSELITRSYKDSFLKEKNIAVSTARAGNVIGGGDFSDNRIIPDCFRAAVENKDILIRNPQSIRPYQHVLEPIFAYLLIAEKQYNDINYSGCYNVGPNEEDMVSTGELVELFCELWGNNQKWISNKVDGPHEANFLKLDCSKIKQIFDWKPVWNITTALNKTIELYKIYSLNENIEDCIKKQIWEYYNRFNERLSN